MNRTFSIQESIIYALRQLKSKYLFFLGFYAISSFIFIVCGFVGAFVLSSIGYVLGDTPNLTAGYILKSIGIQFAFFLPVAFLIWLMIVLTVVALRLHKDMNVSYRDLLIKPRILIMATIALFIINIGLMVVTSLFIAGGMSYFNWENLKWGLRLVKAVLIGRVILSLFVVANTQGREVNPIARSIELTKGNTIKLTILVSLLFLVPMSIEHVLRIGIMPLLLAWPLLCRWAFTWTLIFGVTAIVMIAVLWLTFSILVISHVYKQLKRPDDEQAMMPSAFIN